MKGLNRLYFLYEAYDNYWDFSRDDLHNDIFELVVDGDLSGGPFIKQMHPNEALAPSADAHFLFHGVHAQNYHIFTPAEGKDWAMVWGCQPWIKDLPYANAAYPTTSSRARAASWCSSSSSRPFDYAGCRGGRGGAVESALYENKVIGMSWAVLDYDDVNSKQYNGFWNLSHKTTMYGNASDLVAFRLMPIEPACASALEAQWSFQVIDLGRRLVAFQDDPTAQITAWKWEFRRRHIINRAAPDSHLCQARRVRGGAGSRGPFRQGSSRQGLGRLPEVVEV